MYTLMVAELSRIGRNMFEVTQIINRLGGQKVEIIFVRQPKLSTVGSHRKLLLAIYSYFPKLNGVYLITHEAGAGSSSI
jgi:DNA invertase Pin-like site-specific DNA recombinase